MCPHCWLEPGAQSPELTRGPPELVPNFRFKSFYFHIAATALHVLNSIWFGGIARLSHWGGGGNFLVQMISTCLPSSRGMGGGGRHPVTGGRWILWAQ